MEKQGSFAQMSYLDFIKNILKVELTEDQENLIKLFEENKSKEDYHISLLDKPALRDSGLFNK